MSSRVGFLTAKPTKNKSKKDKYSVRDVIVQKSIRP